MKSYLSKSLLAITTSAVIFSCTPPKSGEHGSEEEEEAIQEVVTEEASSITLTKAPASPDFPDAMLTKKDLKIEATDSLYALNYSLDVKNYELGAQTSDADTRGIANSGKGQHIHYIVNNGPYAAHYMSDIPDQLEKGNYVVLGFLSRSYHESVKSAGAYFIENIVVGDVEPAPADLTTPHLFYSRPKGTYKGKDTEKVMLDFYILNTQLSEEGNKVKATINGESFTISEWTPHYIEGLPIGENTIKLELIDAEGNLIEGPFNSVERTVTLTE